MKTLWVSEEFLYDGSQLKSLFAYQQYGILGDSVVAWIGPCNITAHMVDAEDQRAGEKIEGSKMLHFIVECFGPDLVAAVSLQRLFAAIIMSELMKQNANLASSIFRKGDDIYLRSGHADRKLSISIATTSPVSRLIHFALNVSNLGTPVPTCSLEDFAVDPADFGKTILKQISEEYCSVVEATKKVHPVGSFQSQQS